MRSPEIPRPDPVINPHTFTHNGRYIISGGGTGDLTLYDTETGKEVRQFVGHTSTVWSMAVSPDNQTLVSGS